MRPSSQLSELKTSLQDDSDLCAGDAPVLTPLWSGRVTFFGYGEPTPESARDDRQYPAFVTERLAGVTTSLPPLSSTRSGENAGVSSVDPFNIASEMERGDSALFDVTGRSRRHTNLSSSATSHAGTPEPAVFSPLLRGHTGPPHTRTCSSSFLRSPAGGRSPVSGRSPLRPVYTTAHTSSPGTCSLSLPVCGPDASLPTRGLKLRSQAQSGSVTPFSPSLSSPPFNVDAHCATCAREEMVASTTLPEGALSNERLNEVDPLSQETDRYLSMAWRVHEMTQMDEIRSQEAARRWWAAVREALFYVFILCCSCCFLFSWMMHQRHVSFLLPAYRCGWVPSRKSSALFRSGLYYLVLALVCRFDTAWLSVLWLFASICTCARAVADKSKRKTCRSVSWVCTRMPWGRVWHRWVRLCRHQWSRSGGTSSSGEVTRRESMTRIRRVQTSALPSRSAVGHARSERERGHDAHADNDVSFATQVKRRWNSIASAVRGLPDVLRRFTSWASDRGESFSPFSPPSRSERTAQHEITEATLLI